jgi:hypothetical protein
MEKRSRRRIRDLVALAAFQGLNEIGCARISVMARGRNSSREEVDVHEERIFQQSLPAISLSAMALASLPAAASPLTSLVVFGDSLWDDGHSA